MHQKDMQTYCMYLLCHAGHSDSAFPKILHISKLTVFELQLAICKQYGCSKRIKIMFELTRNCKSSSDLFPQLNNSYNTGICHQIA